MFALALPAVAGLDPMLFWGGLLVIGGAGAAFAIESATREIDPEAAAEASLLEKFRSGVGEAADKRLLKTGFAQSVRPKLEVVGAKLRPVEFFGLVAIGSLLGSILGLVFMGTLGFFGGVALPPTLALLILNRKVKQQRSAFTDQLPEMLQLLGGSLRAGMSFTQALSAVGHESPPPAKEEIRKVLTENRLGRSFVDSMRDVAHRMDSQDFEWVVAAVEVHEDVGGNLADVLDRVAGTIRARNRVRGQVKALSAEGRMSGLVMTALPPGVVGLMWVTNPDYIGELTGTPMGHKLLAAAGTLLLMGSVWLRKMASFKF